VPKPNLLSPTRNPAQPAAIFASLRKSLQRRPRLLRLKLLQKLFSQSLLNQNPRRKSRRKQVLLNRAPPRQALLNQAFLKGVFPKRFLKQTRTQANRRPLTKTAAFDVIGSASAEAR